MTNSIVKRALTVAVAAATILWSVGFAALVPQQASAASFGDLIKGTTLATVYYYGSDGQRYSFPNEKTFFSWYNDFSGVVTMSDAELANITLAGNVVYRPGSRWVKITSDAKTYAVARDGSIRWIESETVAKGLAGDDWNQFIDDVPDVFFVDYSVGDSLTSAASAYEGALVKSGSDNYLVWGGKKMKVSADGMTTNRLKAGFVLDGTGATLSSLTAGSDVTAKLAYLTDAAQQVTTDTYAQTQSVEVAMSSSPAASTLVAGQGIAHLATYEFKNSTTSDVKVTGVKMARKGVSADTTLSNLYLFNGWVRMADSATVSSGVISWNNSAGLFTIPAGQTVNVAVRTDIAAGTSGQTVGVSLDPDDVTYAGSYKSTGSPLASALHTVASVSNFGTVSFATTTTPSADGAPSPENDFRIWDNNVTIGNNEAWLYSLRFRNVGSINAADLGNWKLYVAGVMKGSAVAKQDADGYFTFDLSSAPVKINSGVHSIKVLADVVGGSTRTVQVRLGSTADAVFVEDDYAQPILVQANSTTFSARTAAAQTIAAGELSFTKKSNSASGDVIDGASTISLASFEVKATGEAMKIESLNFNIAENGSDTAFRLRNGVVYVDGVQVGSTTALCGDDTTTASACTGVAGSGASYTQFNFGSSFIVYPGKPVTMELKADAVDNDGTDGVAADDTIRLVIDATALDGNVLRMTSGSYVTRPATDTQGNLLTVRTGGLTVSNNTSYAAQSAVAPKTAHKIGSWTVTASTVESVNLTQYTVSFTGAADAADASDDYSNLYLTYGPTGTENIATTKTTVSDSSNTWSLNYTLKSGETIYVNAYADVGSNISDSPASDSTDDTLTTQLAVDSTTVGSSSSSTGSAVSANTVTWYASGTFTSSVDGSTPVAKAVAGGQTVDAAKYRFTAVRESYTIDQIEVEVETGGATAAGVISKVELYDGSTLLGYSVFSQTGSNDTGDGETDSAVNTSALVTGLSIPVAAGSYKVITAKLVLNDIGSGLARSQQNLLLDLDAFRYSDSQGTVTTSATDRAGNEIRAYNSIPTFTAVDLTNSTIVNGQPMDLYKFTVSANSNGPVAIKQLGFPVSWTDSDADALEMESWKLYKNGSDITTSIVIQDQVGANIEGTAGAYQDDTDRNSDGDATDANEAVASTIYVTWNSEEVVSAGETVTYVLRATPQAFDSDGDTGDEDYFSIYLAGDAAHNSDGGTVGLTEVCLEANSTYATLFDLANAATAYGACSAGTGDTTHNIVWSDMSNESHVTTEDGSSDWANGYLLLNLDLAGETWAK